MQSGSLALLWGWSCFWTVRKCGCSGKPRKKRDEFNRMIADCREGKIDRIIRKSISRFARNTLDCLNYVRELKELGIGIIFEKENIDTPDYIKRIFEREGVQNWDGGTKWQATTLISMLWLERSCGKGWSFPQH